MPQEQPKQEQVEPKIEKVETAQEKPAQTMEDIQMQIEALQKQMEQMKQQSQETASAEIQRLDQSSEKLGTAKPEEMEAVKTEVAQIETQKQEIITQAEVQIQEAGKEVAAEEAPAEKTEITNEISTQEFKTVERPPIPPLPVEQKKGQKDWRDEPDFDKREHKRQEAFEAKLHISSPELQEEFNQAKKSLEKFDQQIEEVKKEQEKVEPKYYEARAGEAKELLLKIPKFRTEFSDILDKPVFIDRTQYSRDQIRFDGVSEREQSELSYRISDLAYEISKNKDFEISAGANLSNLLSQLEDLAKYKSEEQPSSQSKIDAVQQEANIVGNWRKKAREKVEEIEAKIWSS